MKALSRKRGRRNRPGRKLTESFPRTPTQQKSRSRAATEPMTKLELEAATWKRRRENPNITPEEARKPEYGIVIAKWRENHRRFVKRYGKDTPDPHEFTEVHYDTAERYHMLHHRYLSAIEAKRQRSASDYSPAGGYDGRDPFDADLAARHKATEEAYTTARRAVLESGALGHMALQAIVVENKDLPELRSDLRTALNRLAVLWKLAATA